MGRILFLGEGKASKRGFRRQNVDELSHHEEKPSGTKTTKGERVEDFYSAAAKGRMGSSKESQRLRANQPGGERGDRKAVKRGGVARCGIIAPRNIRRWPGEGSKDRTDRRGKSGGRI